MKTQQASKKGKINIAVAGCGRIAQNHLQAIKHHAGAFNLVGVCDVLPLAAKEAANAFNISPFFSLESMLQTIQPDIVSLCTPSGLHAEQAIQVAMAGCHVITEKPMATRWQDGLKMINACDQAGVRLFVVKQNRYNHTLQLLKQAIEQERFGKIYLAHVNVFWTRPQAYYDQASWRGTYEMDGGAFMNQASHYIDLLQWLLGPVESVQAMMGTLARRIEAEDTGVMNMRWRNGALGSASVTMLTYPRNMEGSITILGEKGSVRIGGVALNEVTHWEFAERLSIDDTIRASNYETASVYGFGHTAYYDNVIQVLRDGVEPAVDGREGLKSLALLIAAYRSARDGVTVHLPLEL